MTRQFTSYKLGCNFDPELISKVKALNDKYKDQGVQVDEFFGSDRDHAFLAARPDFRLPEVDKHQLEKYVRASLDAGINFNYTMNSINPGSKRELNEKQGEIKDYIKFLEGIGVHRITAANPIIFEFVRDVSSTMKLEVSTIMHVDTVTQIKYLKDTFNIDKVCGNLLKNRNKRFLKQATDYCNANDVKYEIMVNEFCGVGTDTATTHCSLRDSCVRWDTLVFDYKSNANYQIKDLPVGALVDSVNEVEQRIEQKIVVNKVCNGSKKIFRVKLKSGKYVDITSDHKVLTKDGWKTIETGLGIGDKAVVK